MSSFSFLCVCVSLNLVLCDIGGSMCNKQGFCYEDSTEGCICSLTYESTIIDPESYSHKDDVTGFTEYCATKISIVSGASSRLARHIPYLTTVIYVLLMVTISSEITLS